MLIAYKQINNTYIVFFILFTPRPFIRFCLLIVDIHSFGNELTDIFVVPQQFPYSSRADASQLRFGKEQNGFYSRQFAIDVGYGFLILEVFYSPYSPYDELSVHLLREINGQDRKSTRLNSSH